MSSSINPALKESLQKLAERDQKQGINVLFNKDTQRAQRFSKHIDGLYFDFSKTHLSDQLLELYTGFAEQIGFNERRHAFLSGGHINTSEDRAVLHTLLRDSDNQGIQGGSDQYLQQAEQAKQEFIAQYQLIKQQLAQREVPVQNIIHVGIGGSSLGTQLLFESLKQLGESINIHFLGNIDAHQLVAVLDQCAVENTLVVGVSKTFSTAETLKNLNSIGKWYAANGIADYLDNYIAVTANPDNALSFGIASNNIVTFPTWVGGRYSVWSSVSLSAALVLGMDKFEEFLAGAALMDQHFYQTTADSNICFLAAALDHYYINYLGAGSRAVFAYDYRLRSLVNYLQQLETESNGKDRQRDGSPVDQLTAPVVWGGVGTDVQHSVFQLLHQGTLLIPAEFILVKTPNHNLLDHHAELLANGVAQAAALLSGQDIDTVKALNADQAGRDEKKLTDLTLNAKVFSGERPSTTILMDKLTPKALGALLSFYEHRTFCGGVFTNINSFDQMGVELGKRLANEVKPILNDEQSLQDHDLDQSTKALIEYIKRP